MGLKLIQLEGGPLRRKIQHYKYTIIYKHGNTLQGVCEGPWKGPVWMSLSLLENQPLPGLLPTSPRTR